MSFRSLLNNLLELKRVTKTADDAGGFTESWDSIGYFYGRICPVSAGERMLADKKYADLTHKIYCEAMDVRENDKIVWGDWTFQIIGILNPSEEFHHLQILAKEVD